MKKQAKISVMHITYDMRIGGTEMVIKNLIEGSDSELFDMSIYCIETPIGPWGIEMQNAGLAITATARKPGFDIALIFAIRKHIKTHNIGLLHCHQYTPWVYGVMAAFGTKTKVIFTEHGRFYPDSSTWKRKLINPWLGRITTYITAISQATKQALVEFENLPKERIEVIYNGIKPLKVDSAKTLALKQKLKIPDKSLVLGTIARLDPIKNHLMMLDAFSLVLKTHPDAVLIIVGDGEERDSIIKHIRVLGIENKVLMPGYDPQPQHYLALMDIFLLSSLSEGTSMTLLEAMSLKKPCVVTDAGGNKEVIANGENGIVTTNDDATEFSQAILTLVNDKVLLNQYGEASQKRFGRLFDISVMVKRFSKFYQNR
jgi:glycosyltransferase involved in cell wall biosynthesis